MTLPKLFSKDYSDIWKCWIYKIGKKCKSIPNKCCKQRRKEQLASTSPGDLATDLCDLSENLNWDTKYRHPRGKINCLLDSFFFRWQLMAWKEKVSALPLRIYENGSSEWLIFWFSDNSLNLKIYVFKILLEYQP